MDRNDEETGDLSRRLMEIAKIRQEGALVHRVGIYIGLVVGAFLCLGGAIVVILGLGGAVDWVVQGKDIASKLTNASPGVLFLLSGTVILWRFRPAIDSNLKVEYSEERTLNDAGMVLIAKRLSSDHTVLQSVGRAERAKGAEIGLKKVRTNAPTRKRGA